MKNLNHPTDISRYGHFVVAMDPGAFMPEEEYAAKLAEMAANVKACGDPGAVFLPGEKSYALAQANKDSVEIGDKLVAEFNELILSLHAGACLKESI